MWNFNLHILELIVALVVTWGFSNMDGLLRESLFTVGFPGAYGDKESACQYRRHKRHRFNLWVGKIPWRRSRQPTPVFLPGIPWTEEPGGLQSLGLQRVGQDWSYLAYTHAHPQDHRQVGVKDDLLKDKKKLKNVRSRKHIELIINLQKRGAQKCRTNKSRHQRIVK